MKHQNKQIHALLQRLWQLKRWKGKRFVSALISIFFFSSPFVFVVVVGVAISTILQRKHHTSHLDALTLRKVLINASNETKKQNASLHTFLMQLHLAWATAAYSLICTSEATRGTHTQLISKYLLHLIFSLQ